MSLNFGQIRQLTTELADLEHLNKSMSPLDSVAIDLICFKLADNKEMHNILDELEFRPDGTAELAALEHLETPCT